MRYNIWKYREYYLLEQRSRGGGGGIMYTFIRRVLAPMYTQEPRERFGDRETYTRLATRRENSQIVMCRTFIIITRLQECLLMQIIKHSSYAHRYLRWEKYLMLRHYIIFPENLIPPDITSRSTRIVPFWVRKSRRDTPPFFLFDIPCVLYIFCILPILFTV